MRTTLDIDDDILQAAKELAATEKKTAGRVLSDLARRALTTSDPSESKACGPHGAILEDGWYTLPRRGVVVTKELVDRLIEETELEDGRLSLSNR